MREKMKNESMFSVFGRVYFSLQRDGHSPKEVPEIKFEYLLKQILTPDMEFLCFMPCSPSAHRPRM